MKENLYIFSNSESKNEMDRYKIDNNSTILIINPIIFRGTKGQRYKNVYCDKTFLKSTAGRNLIKYVFKDFAYSSFSYI